MMRILDIALRYRFTEQDSFTRWVKQGAGMWMRVDGPEERVLAFDNMTSRLIQGTTYDRMGAVYDRAGRVSRAEANSALAWLRLVVAYSIIIGFG
ncbi:hypothetical protein ABEX25_22915 [Paenibacillus thiaminolyticus]|uniref:hypothetical protein n=1 Tax=Paenibacillus thiaminolyticus TaxID=49283 RepID=UPI003D29445F